jgi:hypothetical protein
MFISGVNDTGDKLFGGVNDTGNKLFSGVNDTGDNFSAVSATPAIRESCLY